MRKFVFIILLLLPNLIFAQSQQIGFLHNQSLTNPAFTGSHDGTLITLSYNQLWGGMQNAPATQIATLSSRLGNNVGFGGAIIQQSKGPMSIGGIQANYAYHLTFGSKANLALGLHANFSVYSLDESQLILDDPNDPAISGGIKRKIAPDAGTGVYFYTEKINFGIAAYQLMQKEISFSNLVSDSIAQNGNMSIFINAGASLKIGESMKFEPSFLVNQSANSPLFFDAGLSVLLKEQLKIGASFRSTETLLVKIGFIRNNSFTVAYAYGYSLSESSYIQGSHEIMVSYPF